MMVNEKLTFAEKSTQISVGYSENFCIMETIIHKAVQIAQ